MPTVEHPAGAPQAQARRRELGRRGAFVAGGTALQLGWATAPPPATLLSVAGLPSAQGVMLAGGVLRLGAAVRLEALRRDAIVALHAPLLVDACSGIAALSVRHLATLGGNVAWGFGDTLPVLLALGARVEGADGRCEPLPHWLARDEGALIVALQLDVTGAAFCFFEKVGHRAAFSPTRLAMALCAARDAPGRLRDVRVAVSGSGLRARHLPRVAQALDGARPGDAIEERLRAACAADLAQAPALARIAAGVLAGKLAEAEDAH